MSNENKKEEKKGFMGRMFSGMKMGAESMFVDGLVKKFMPKIKEGVISNKPKVFDFLKGQLYPDKMSEVEKKAFETLKAKGLITEKEGKLFGPERIIILKLTKLPELDANGQKTGNLVEDISVEIRRRTFTKVTALESNELSLEQVHSVEYWVDQFLSGDVEKWFKDGDQPANNNDNTKSLLP